MISCRTSNRIITLDEFAWGADEGKKEEGNKIGRGRGKFVVLKNQISSGQVTRTEEGGGREGCVSETACICRWDASALQIKAGEGEARERKRAPISRGEGIVELGNCPLPRNFAKVASNSLARCLQFLAPYVMNVSESRLRFFSSRPANLATSERTWTWTGSAQGKRILEAVTLKKRAREGFIYKKAALKRRSKASYVKLRKLRWNFPPLSLSFFNNAWHGYKEKFVSGTVNRTRGRHSTGFKQGWN